MLVIQLPTLLGHPLIFTIGFDHDAIVMNVGGVSDSAFLDGHYRAGTAGMYRGTNKPFSMRDDLTGQHVIADLDDGLCRFTDVLLQG